jgi:hypothetical protein
MMLIFVFTDPGNGLPATNMSLGTDAASEVLILTPDPMATLAPSLPPIINSISDLGKMTPVEFLNVLKKEPATEECLFRDPIKNWISKKDLPALLSLTDSDEPCPSVALMRSSYYDTRNHSTVGQEAAFMLEGYRKGEYPPGPNSIVFDDSKEASEARMKANEEIINWCRSQLDAAK